MGLFFGLFVGFVLGVGLVAGLKYMMGLRNKSRTLKAVGISLLGHISQDDVKRLCIKHYPSWLSFPSFEKVKWLNKMLEKIWPSVAMAASKLIETIVEPMLQTYCPPGFKMKFTKLFLGNVAPYIEGIKMQMIKQGQLIMDMDFKWGGDPSIILAVRTPVGANLPIQLKNLKFFAKVRIIFQLTEDIPCIAGVVVALLAQPKPEVRYTLKLIGGSLSGVPGISDVIKDIVNTAVADTLQWPHRIVVPIAQPPVDLSDLELKLQGRLTVTVVRATSLKNMDLVGKSDPYVIVYVRVLFKFKTRVVDNNLNPEWQETFEFDVEDQETQSLVLQVMDEDIGADKLMGVAIYPLLKFKPEETTELTLSLTPAMDMDNVKDHKDRGSITLTVKYHVFTPEEQADAMEAERAFLEAKKKAAEEGLIGGAMDAIGGAVGGAGKLMIGGVEGAGKLMIGGVEGAGKLMIGGVGKVGTGVGMVGTGIGKAGKFVSKSVSGSFTQRKTRSAANENGVPGTPK